MIKRILIVLNLLLLHVYYSQIKIEFRINSNSNKVTIVLINNSNDYMALPLDTSSLRPYFDDICLDIAEHTYHYPTLALNIKVSENGKIVESLGGTGEIDDFNVKRNIKSDKEKYKNRISLWQKKNNIKSFNDAEINYYIFKNLIYLRPGEKVEKELYFDLRNVTNEEYIHYYYYIEQNKNYQIALYYNINNCAYQYLTKLQKNKLKNYKLFTGELESNNIELKY